MVSDEVGGYHGRAGLGPLVESGQDSRVQLEGSGVKKVGAGGGIVVQSDRDIIAIRTGIIVSSVILHIGAGCAERIG